MLDKDNIISASVSKAVEKIPTDVALLCTATACTKNRPTYIANSRNSCLLTRIHPVYLRKSLKIFYIKLSYKEKGAIICI